MKIDIQVCDVNKVKNLNSCVKNKDKYLYKYLTKTTINNQWATV